jgi:hypothetical protein
MIDDRLRSAARDIRVEAGSRIPPPLRAVRNRVATIAAGGLIIVALIAGVVLYSRRQSETSSVVDQSSSSSTDTGASSTTTLPSVEIIHVGEQELSDFIGTYQIDYQVATQTLGQVGTSELTLEMTAQSFCLRFVATDSSGCRYSADGSTLPTQPERLFTNIGSSELSAAAPLISLVMVVPDGVELRVLNGDQPVCELQRFPLSQFGSAVVWACQGRGPTDHWELAATKDGRTLAGPAFATAPDPTASVP